MAVTLVEGLFAALQAGAHQAAFEVLTMLEARVLATPETEWFLLQG